MRQFDFHEFLGYIAPGMLFLVGLACIWPEAEKILPLKDITFGEFGIGVVLAYAAGQLVQTFGNVIAKYFWRFLGGMPTDWIRTGKHELIDPRQRELVKKHVARMLNDESFEFDGVTDKQWYSITRQIYATVAASDRAGRIDVFNGHYGLCRGIIGSSFFLLSISLLMDLHAWKVHLLLIFPVVLAMHRMYLFGLHYGNELFVQFLEASSDMGRGNL